MNGTSLMDLLLARGAAPAPVAGGGGTAAATVESVEAAPRVVAPATTKPVKSAVTLRQFYTDVLPAAGSYALFLGADKAHVWVDSIDDLVRETEARRDTQGVYFATQSFREKGHEWVGRKADNAYLFRSFRLDIDAGPEKHAKHGDTVYPTQPDAVQALASMLKASGLRPRYLIGSGAGLHVYFALSEDVEADDWKPVAQRLQAFCAEHVLKVDAAVTANLAQILRPPGTLHKAGTRVEVMRETAQVYTLAQFADAIGYRPAPNWDLSVNCDVMPLPGPPASVNKILPQCAALRELTTHQTAVPEPAWRAMLGLVKHTVEGDEAAHKFSEQHPDYDYGLTQKKLDGWTAGPTTCSEFSLHSHECAACKHNGKIKSPIVLGGLDVAEVQALPAPVRVVAEAQVEAVQAVAAQGGDAVVAEFNREWFVASSGAGTPSIWREFRDPENPDAWRIAPVPRERFALLHENRTVVIADATGKARPVKAALHWLSHPGRRQYPNGMGLFTSGEAPAGVYNLWRGLGVEPKEGDVSLMLDHVRMVCQDNEELIAYFIKWCAFAVQHPDRQAGVAVVLRGGEGTGKGTVVRPLLRMFGSHGWHVTQSSHLTGKHNSHLQGALFLFCDEGYWAGSKEGEGVLKGLITEPTLMIEPKGIDAYAAPNRLKVVFASNNAWVVPASADARRFCVIDVPDTRARDHAYFDRLNTWLENGGLEAWMHHLLHVDLSGFNIRAAPSTAALDAQKLEGMTPIDRWLMECLDQGTVPGGGQFWADDGAVAVCSEAVEAFADYCRRAAGGRYTQADARVIGARLGRVFGCGASDLVQHRGTRAKAWRLPGLATARQQAAQVFGLRHYVWQPV